ncbi:MAG: hypothetical protein HOP21_01840 [Methylotenera sp.]|nr:hypothetical protein [Methylotenera sp.]
MTRYFSEEAGCGYCFSGKYKLPLVPQEASIIMAKINKKKRLNEVFIECMDSLNGNNPSVVI